MFTILGIQICLIVIVYQDWELRAIHVALPVVISVLAYINTKYSLPFSHILYNIFFFMLVFGILTLYMSIKNKKWSNPLTNYFGLGDVLFYIAVSPIFLVYDYGIFFIVSMLFAIFLHFVLARFYRHQTIPLAGYAALLLIGVIVYDFLNFGHKFTMLQWQR